MCLMVFNVFCLLFVNHLKYFLSYLWFADNIKEIYMMPDTTQDYRFQEREYMGTEYRAEFYFSICSIKTSSSISRSMELGHLTPLEALWYVTLYAYNALWL